MNILQLILSILSGLVACIPLAIELVKQVEHAAKEKNWRNLFRVISAAMPAAEDTYDTPEAKKSAVMRTIKELSSSINYDMDEAELSKLIDDICALTKQVNVH